MGSDETAVVWLRDDDGDITIESEPTLDEALTSALVTLDYGLGVPIVVEYLDPGGNRRVLQGGDLEAALVAARQTAGPAEKPAPTPWRVEVQEPPEVLALTGRGGWGGRWVLLSEAVSLEAAEELCQELLGPILETGRVRIMQLDEHALRTEPPPEAVTAPDTPGLCLRCDRFHLGSECHAPGHPSRKGSG